MRWILPLCFLGLLVCTGCSNSNDKADRMAGIQLKGKANNQAPPPGEKAEADVITINAPGSGVVFKTEQEGKPGEDKKQPEQKAKEKPRKIRYSADMKLIVEKLDEAEEALDAARKEAKGEYEKAEVNSSSNVVRSGMWRVRVPVENLNDFRKAVKKIGEVERDTIESEDMTARYYDLDAHLTNRKAEQTATREFLIEIGKKDPRYLEVKRELDAISDDINRKEGQLKLWANLTDLTTFTIHMREKQPYLPAAKVEEREVPTFELRAGTTWNTSLDAFVGFCQWIAIVAIAVTPWLPVPLVLLVMFWVFVRFLVRATKK